MAKITKEPTGAIFPTPVVLVTTAGADGGANIITLAWVGIVCSGPLTISVAIRPSRHSHKLLGVVPELVVNVPTREILEKTDHCGMVSGRDEDKFAATGLTAAPADLVRPPLIEECPISLECKVVNRLSLGTHDVYIAEVLVTHVEEDFLDGSGKIDFGRLAPFVYVGMDYWSLGEKIGHYGFSATS